MSKVEEQLTAYETQLKDCEDRIEATRESFEQLKTQQQQLRGAIFAVKETIKNLEEKEESDVKES